MRKHRKTAARTTKEIEEIKRNLNRAAVLCLRLFSFLFIVTWPAINNELVHGQEIKEKRKDWLSRRSKGLDFVHCYAASLWPILCKFLCRRHVVGRRLQESVCNAGQGHKSVTMKWLGQRYSTQIPLFFYIFSFYSQDRSIYNCTLRVRSCE